MNALEFLVEFPWTIAGLAMVTLGVVLLRLDPGAAAARAFGAFLVLAGATRALNFYTLVPDAGPRLAQLLHGYSLNPLVLAAFLVFALHYPRARGSERFRRRAVAFVLAYGALAFALLVAAPDAMGRLVIVDGQVGVESPHVLFLAVNQARILAPVLVGIGIFLASARTEGGGPLSHVLVAFALVVDRAYVRGLAFGVSSAPSGVGWERAAEYAVVATSVAVAAAGVACLYGAWRQHGPARRAFLLAGSGVAVAYAAGASASYLPVGANAAIFGGAFLAQPALVAYALLRHQAFDVDVRLRWTISRGTVAAAFVAIFFVASEGAQLLFGAENAVLGLAAAGALVFAIAPLQRAADRLAERAVPVAAAPSTVPAVAPNQEDAYRRAVGLALRGRRLTHEEEIHLFHVAEALGVPAGRAMEIRHEVEREGGA